MWRDGERYRIVADLGADVPSELQELLVELRKLATTPSETDR